MIFSEFSTDQDLLVLEVEPFIVDNFQNDNYRYSLFKGSYLYSMILAKYYGRKYSQSTPLEECSNYTYATTFSSL